MNDRLAHVLATKTNSIRPSCGNDAPSRPTYSERALVSAGSRDSVRLGTSHDCDINRFDLIGGNLRIQAHSDTLQRTSALPFNLSVGETNERVQRSKDEVIPGRVTRGFPGVALKRV